LHGELGLSVGVDVAEVVVTGPAAMIAENFAGPSHNRRPTQIVQAQFALPFLLATTSLRGRLGIGDVADFENPELLALAARMRGEPADGAVAISAREISAGQLGAAIGIVLTLDTQPDATALWRALD
jgi:hypothetical protein